MKIADLKPNQREVNLEEVKVVELSPVRTFSRFGEPGRVCNALIKDDTGEVSFTLWDSDVDKVKEGDTLRINNAYVKEWQGRLQVNTGRRGSFEVLK